MVIAAERELDAALHSAIGELAAAQRGARGGGLVEELMATAPTELAKLELSTRALADRVGMQRVFAEEVSGAVRAMDVQKARLELALKCVDDIIELTKGSAAHEVNTQQIDWAGGEVLELSLRKAIKAQDEAEVARLVKLAAPLGEGQHCQSAWSKPQLGDEVCQRLNAQIPSCAFHVTTVWTVDCCVGKYWGHS